MGAPSVASSGLEDIGLSAAAEHRTKKAARRNGWNPGRSMTAATSISSPNLNSISTETTTTEDGNTTTTVVP
eukprot:CAMPEP_0204137922 /NCGR_PEP_ID=MMETSP0361-20130328/17695_1 /ASSEMBLY_ACC=CAM_ASM_000343 /TAXON_ID=268821 /ORGANISM="Scrippsiella Hangoei, Strain SHTV-5" /LENGTH=71 /DNA_ID=CAMNT_0051091679 /DNA_START=17 /DNA_END=228 /DNA_ORIENTATION=+